MDFAFTDEQNELRALARQILEDKVSNERLKQVEAGDPVFDRELWRELARSQLLGSALPEEFGGSGLGLFELALLLQEVGRAVAPVPAFASLVLGALPLAEFGSPAQKRELLPPLIEGELILSAALLEPDSDDPLSPATRAHRAAGGWRIEGHKTAVPAGTLAARILAPARCDDGRILLFWIRPGAEGVELTAQQSSDRQPHARLLLKRAPVDEADLLGELDRGEEILKWLVDRATLALCAIQLGVSERGLEMTAAYTADRRQFDRPIGSFQAVHQRAADAYIDVEAIRLSTWEAAWRLASGLPADDAIAVAKYWAAEGGQSAARAFTHLHGGIGIDVDYPLHRYFIWSTQIEHILGGAQAQLARLGARIAEGSTS